jgi:uncharacterized membrane protein YkvA (DUF1232 family)
MRRKYQSEMEKIFEVHIRNWRTKSKHLKSEVFAVYLASKHPKTPWYAKALAVFIIGYASSPIDLIPDFIPVIGYLDDLIVVPAGIALLVKMIPKEVLEECRERARSQSIMKKPKSWTAVMVIVMIWLAVIYLTFRILWHKG